MAEIYTASTLSSRNSQLMFVCGGANTIGWSRENVGYRKVWDRVIPCEPHGNWGFGGAEKFDDFCFLALCQGDSRVGTP